MTNLVERLKAGSFTRPVLLRLRDVVDRVFRAIGYRQSQDALNDAAQHYWVDDSTSRYASDGHWRGAGLFADDKLWLDVGRNVLDRYRRMTSGIQPSPAMDVIVDWGCGGGANAIHFAPLCREYIGVDVSPRSLEECERQLSSQGLDNFRTVQINVGDPEAALTHIEACNLFICTYVFEILPSPEYGERLLRIAHSMLNPDGIALIQIKYRTDDWRTDPKGYAYSLNAVSMTTYRVERFWELALKHGFTPELVQLEPVDPVVDDERYAYYLLRKPV